MHDQRNHIAFSALLLTLAVVLNATAQSGDGISPEALRRHMLTLADDSLQGRAVGSPGIQAAAEYLRTELKRYGVAPLPSLPSYFQTFPVHGSRATEESDLRLFAPRDAYALRLQEDYVLFSSGAQTFIPLPVRMVFVGYGIIAPEYDYNDYRDIDVRNAVVVFLTGEPRSDDDSYFDGERSTVHAEFTLKQRIALARGARGSVLLPNPNDRSLDDWYEQQRHFRFEEMRPVVTPSENFNAMLNPKLGPFLFSQAPYSYDDVTAFDRQGTMRSFDLPMMVSFQGRFHERDVPASNVIGVIDGSDPALRGSYVLLTAHYDHLGVGPAAEGDSVYNGLVDNASGTAALLELARVLQRERNGLRRSVLIAFLTGEERGFLGSQYNCLNPPVPLYRTAANVNIDGLSLFERVRSVIGIGAELSTLGETLDRALEGSGVTREALPPDLFRPDQFRKSDQFMFAQAGIPSLLVAEGLRYETTAYAAGLERYAAWSDSVYHSPKDDASQPLNFDAALQHTAIIHRLVLRLANDDAVPEWRTGVIFRQERLRTNAERR